ncbi:MAG: hypothetical protein P8076_04520 [Gammaproteobacteria bacterium]
MQLPGLRGRRGVCSRLLRSVQRGRAANAGKIPPGAIGPALAECKRLRFRDENIYLRNTSINRINGIIGMTFSCERSHYAPLEEFVQTAQQFQLQLLRRLVAGGFLGHRQV